MTQEEFEKEMKWLQQKHFMNAMIDAFKKEYGEDFAKTLPPGIYKVTVAGKECTFTKNQQ